MTTTDGDVHHPSMMFSIIAKILSAKLFMLKLRFIIITTVHVGTRYRIFVFAGSGCASGNVEVVTNQQQQRQQAITAAKAPTSRGQYRPQLNMFFKSSRLATMDT